MAATDTLDQPLKEIVPISVVRQWAIKKGLPVGRRGHLPESVIASFNRAHQRKLALSKNPAVVTVS